VVTLTLCFLIALLQWLFALYIFITMPKAEPLYNHSTRKATARQLNLSTSASGRSSYSYTSSTVPVAPVAHEAHPDHEYYLAAGMDIDGDDADTANNPGTANEPGPMDVDETIEVVPGVNVHIVPTKTKAKRYANSVGFLCLIFLALLDHSSICRTCLSQPG
jgi:hypothetical protein